MPVPVPCEEIDAETTVPVPVPTGSVALLGSGNGGNVSMIKLSDVVLASAAAVVAPGNAVTGSVIRIGVLLSSRPLTAGSNDPPDRGESVTERMTGVSVRVRGS